jgi:hypothetical protein
MVRGTPEPDVAELSMTHALEIAEATKPYVTGFHIISGPTPKLAFQLVNRVSEWARAGEARGVAPAERSGDVWSSNEAEVGKQ